MLEERVNPEVVNKVARDLRRAYGFSTDEIDVFLSLYSPKHIVTTGFVELDGAQYVSRIASLTDLEIRLADIFLESLVNPSKKNLERLEKEANSIHDISHNLSENPVVTTIREDIQSLDDAIAKYKEMHPALQGMADSDEKRVTPEMFEFVRMTYNFNVRLENYMGISYHFVNQFVATMRGFDPKDKVAREQYAVNVAEYILKAINPDGCSLPSPTSIQAIKKQRLDIERGFILVNSDNRLVHFLKEEFENTDYYEKIAKIRLYKKAIEMVDTVNCSSTTRADVTRVTISALYQFDQLGISPKKITPYIRKAQGRPDVDSNNAVLRLFGRYFSFAKALTATDAATSNSLCDGVHSLAREWGDEFSRVRRRYAKDSGLTEEEITANLSELIDQFPTTPEMRRIDGLIELYETLAENNSHRSIIPLMGNSSWQSASRREDIERIAQSHPSAPVLLNEYFGYVSVSSARANAALDIGLATLEIDDPSKLVSEGLKALRDIDHPPQLTSSYDIQKLIRVNAKGKRESSGRSQKYDPFKEIYSTHNDLTEDIDRARENLAQYGGENAIIELYSTNPSRLSDFVSQVNIFASTPYLPAILGDKKLFRWYMQRLTTDNDESLDCLVKEITADESYNGNHFTHITELLAPLEREAKPETKIKKTSDTQKVRAYSSIYVVGSHYDTVHQDRIQRDHDSTAFTFINPESNYDTQSISRGSLVIMDISGMSHTAYYPIMSYLKKNDIAFAIVGGKGQAKRVISKHCK